MDCVVRQAREVYEKCAQDEQNYPALCTCKTLLHFVENDDSGTFLEYSKKLTLVMDSLKDLARICEVDSTAEIFARFTTLRASEFETMDEARDAFRVRGEMFLKKIQSCCEKIARNSYSFISDGNAILVHASSPAVSSTLLHAKNANRRFSVYVTRCADNSGEDLHNLLVKNRIYSQLIPDSAIGFFMEKVDIILVGAEGVVENGGIISKIGTYPLSLVAKATNKPFYAIAESYKFVRLFPISQMDIPARLRSRNIIKGQPHQDPKKSVSSIDYTPPSLITLLLTDLGPLTTAAVSDVLLNLYL